MICADKGLGALIADQTVPNCAYCSQPVSYGQVLINGLPFHGNCAEEVMQETNGPSFKDGTSIDTAFASDLQFPPGQWPSEFTREGKVYKLAHVQYVSGMDVLQVLNT